MFKEHEPHVEAPDRQSHRGRLRDSCCVVSSRFLEGGHARSLSVWIRRENQPLLVVHVILTSPSNVLCPQPKVFVPENSIGS